MPDIGHNLSKETYLLHQARAVLDREKAEELAKLRKRHRKDAELAGVPLGDMDWVIKTLSMPVGEIASFFRQKLQLLTFNGVNVAVKLDKVLGDHTEDQTYPGQLAGMAGKPASPPANLTPNERETWLSGYHDGAAARARAAALGAEEEEKHAAAREAARMTPDASTAAAQELADDGYGEDDAPAAKTDDEEDEIEPEQPPHKSVRRERIRKTPEPTA